MQDATRTGQASAQDVIRPAKLAHIVFRTPDLARMIDWYCTFLGAHSVYRDAAIAFLTYDEEHHRIALLQSDDLLPRPEGKMIGFYHAAFTYRDLPELLANYQRLKALGIEPYRRIIHGPTVSLYYADPDGNEIETQIDVFADAETAATWMHGEVFARNPIGVDFDPEEMLRRLAEGVSVEELKRRPDDPRPV